MVKNSLYSLIMKNESRKVRATTGVCCNIFRCPDNPDNDKISKEIKENILNISQINNSNDGKQEKQDKIRRILEKYGRKCK